MNKLPIINETYSKIIVTSDLREGDEFNDYYTNCTITGGNDVSFLFKFESLHRMFQGELIRIDGPAHPRTSAITIEKDVEFISHLE
jgi:hypothetical protein